MRWVFCTALAMQGFIFGERKCIHSPSWSSSLDWTSLIPKFFSKACGCKHNIYFVATNKKAYCAETGIFCALFFPNDMSGSLLDSAKWTIFSEKRPPDLMALSERWAEAENLDRFCCNTGLAIAARLMCSVEQSENWFPDRLRRWVHRSPQSREGSYRKWYLWFTQRKMKRQTLFLNKMKEVNTSSFGFPFHTLMVTRTN